MISLHYPDGTIVSPKLLSQERFDWLSLQYHIHAPPYSSPPFLEALCSLLLRYHPLAATSSPKGWRLNQRHHMAMPRAITQVLHTSFSVTSELFTSPLNCSMLPGLTFCTPCKEDEAFGGVHDAFSFRWTGACYANPAPVPEDMHTAALHAIESARHSETPFLCFLALPSWERASWKSEDILYCQDIEILLRLWKGHLKLVPPEESLELPNPKLQPTDWPLDMVIVANAEGRSKWLSATALQEALVPAVRAVCQVPDQHLELFPPDARTRPTRPPRLYSHPVHPLPTPPLPSWGSQPSLGLCRTGLPPLELWSGQPDLRQVGKYTSPTDRPLHIVEICGGLATGLHAALRAGHAVASYSRADINPDALVAVRARLRRLHLKYPNQLPLSALTGWNTRLPFNANCLSPGVLRNFPNGIHWVVAGPPCQPYSHAGKHKGTRDPRSTALLNVARLIRLLEEVQPSGVGFILENVPGLHRHPEILDMLGPGVELDAPPGGSGTKRATRFRQNFMDPEALREAFDDLPAPNRSVNDLLRQHDISDWSTQAMVLGYNIARYDKYNEPGAPQIALPKLVCYPGSHAFRIKKGGPGPGMMFHLDELKEPDAAVAEVLLGFDVGDTAAEGLSDHQRRHLLGQCIDMNLLTWRIQTISPVPAPPTGHMEHSDPASPDYLTIEPSA